jgi:hypothetical protein
MNAMDQNPVEGYQIFLDREFEIDLLAVLPG